MVNEMEASWLDKEIKKGHPRAMIFFQNVNDNLLAYDASSNAFHEPIEL